MLCAYAIKFEAKLTFQSTQKYFLNVLIAAIKKLLLRFNVVWIPKNILQFLLLVKKYFVYIN